MNNIVTWDNKHVNLDDFRANYRAEVGPGRKVFSRINSYTDYINAGTAGYDNIYNLHTHEDKSAQIEISMSDFARLVEDAAVGREHRAVRQLNPAAQEAYAQYRTIFCLTQMHRDK